MTGDTHYDLDILADLAEGLLDAGPARQVREHLAVCDPCGELLADLAAVREVLAATPTPAMPMGVALRIDKALAVEAESLRGGASLARTPDWDELMRDAPWESPVEEPARLGVVSDDGTIVPALAVAERRRVSRRRRWAMPAVAAAAAAAVVGTAVASTSLLASGSGSGGSSGGGGQQLAQPKPSTATRVPQKTPKYALTDSGHNYSDAELRQPLERFFAPAPILEGGSSDAAQVATCAREVSSRTKLKIFAVDQGHYNGQEAIIMASRKSEAAKRIRLDIVDPFKCGNLRKPMIGRW
ncbi:zf-HC2 domain-containing protein [Nonomuraea lactucae]|uniref:zf-HC2 domain-containing protein n=1 Tax=Nonomuraea lactucae TaxID=2249762 RepID=UPI0013B3C332|nr:zf-HC2 domain-containing protein [Nonomuraea lactucae]